jgi:hypothetical protein
MMFSVVRAATVATQLHGKDISAVKNPDTTIEKSCGFYVVRAQML